MMTEEFGIRHALQLLAFVFVMFGSSQLVAAPDIKSIGTAGAPHGELLSPMQRALAGMAALKGTNICRVPRPGGYDQSFYEPARPGRSAATGWLPGNRRHGIFGLRTNKTCICSHYGLYGIRRDCFG